MPSATLLGQSLLSGVFVGSLYGLIGLGLSLSWGMLRQINLAYFGLAFLGAYITYQFGAGGLNPMLSLAAVVPGFFLAGVAMNWLFVRFKVSPFNSLLLTFGVTVMLEAAIQAIWSADFRRLEFGYTAVNFKIGALFVPLPGLLTLAMSAILSFAAWSVLRYTDLGRAMRAAAQDAPVAAAFGVDTAALARLLAGICAASAGVAGVALALLYALSPAQIYAWIGTVFAAVMIGGLGNPLGPLIAGIVIGVSEAATMAVTAPAWAPLVSFSLLILVLLARARRA